MNKKFSTLVASLLLASAFSTYAQQDSPLMPRSAAVVGQFVTELAEVGTGSNNYKSNGYYQLKTSTRQAENKVLAMVWNAADESYYLKVVDLSQNDQPLDNTLWQISASWDKTSGMVNYIFVNKATMLPLQVTAPGLDRNGTINAPVDAKIAGSVTNWTWNGNVKNLIHEDFVAAISTTHKVYLYVDADGETVKVRQLESQTSVPTTGTYTALKASPVEAGRVILTADQINSKLNNATGDDKNRLDIVFTPDVENPKAENAYNVITETAWVAQGIKYDLNTSGQLVQDPTVSTQYQIPDFATWTGEKTIDEGFVQLQSLKEPSKFLMVDTAYYDAEMNDEYDLKLVAKELVKNQKNYNTTTGRVYTAHIGGVAAYYSFQDQTLFKFYYEPTYDRVLIQAKQITTVKKTDLKDGKSFAWQADVIAAYNPNVNYGTVKAVNTGVITSTGIIESDVRDGSDVFDRNMIKLVYLVNNSSYKHSEVTVNVPDANDKAAGAEGYNGALTQITLKGTKGLLGEWTYANIEAGYYYIQNAKTLSTSLIPSGAWAYQDLTATSASGRTDGNVVYSTEKFETMPSAQWYISGEAGYFTITNRESNTSWSTNYWYAVKDKDGKDVPNTYTNYGTFNGSGISTGEKDTIRIEKIAESVLTAKKNGYLNISQAEAMADTSVFTFKYVTPLDVNLNIDMKSDSTLAMSADNALNFKLERVSKDDAKYGYAAATKYQLERVAYYIYADEVSSNSTEETGYHERKYVVLEGGVYRLANMLVKDKADGTTDAIVTNGYDRAQFYVKEIGEAGKNYVLVDGRTIGAPAYGQGSGANGVRMVVDQVSLGMRANGLPSVAENVYSNSLLNLVRAASGNYRADLAYGDTVKIFSNEYPEVVMCENNNMLAMSSLEVGRDYNTAMFVDTAYVRYNTARPQFMFVLRPVEDPNCNFPNHEHHAIEGDYLMHMQDSVAVDVNKYTWDNKKFARLGFVPARHEGDSVIVKNSKFTGNSDLLYPGTTNVDYKATTIASQDTMILSDNTKDQYCTFALRYVDTNRDAFYLETLFKKGSPETRYETAVADKRGWVRWHNGVPVVVDDLSQAGKFNFEGTDEAPTANDAIATSEVSVVAGAGVVTIKGAAGKKVAISNILGQTIANQVLSSDNETITVPAGIVVVAIAGEEAVKTVVK